MPCMICSSRTEQHRGFCSTSCAAAAQREVERNAAEIRSTKLSHVRLRLAERNGYLQSALLSWRPEDATAG